MLGLGLVLAIAAYSGCEMQDRPFSFLGDDCYKNGIYWNTIAAPIGTLSLLGIVIGPAMWILLLISARAIRLVQMISARKR